jgi:phage FluMu gp28-like protein
MYDEEEIEDKPIEDIDDYEGDIEEDGENNGDYLDLPIPHAAQQAIIDSPARFKVLNCGRRFGKTLVCQIIAIYGMLEKQKICYVTPEFGFAKDLFGEFLALIPKKLIKSANKSDLKIVLKNNGSIKFFSGEALKNIRGKKYHKIIIDEAAHIPDLEAFYNAAIRPTITDYKGQVLFISTPNGKNYFYQLYLRGKNKENGYESFHYPTSANPWIDPAEIEAARLEMPVVLFNQEYLAIPGENQGNPFRTEDIINNTIKTLSKKPAIVYGIDLAKTVDYSVCVGLDEDGKMCHFERWQSTHEDSKNRIKALPKEAMKVMDSTGIGDPIFEELEPLVTNLHSFKFTGQSKPMIMKKLIGDFERGELKVNDFVADEMQVFEYWETEAGNVKYEAQAGYHDDSIMALAMANYYRDKYFSVHNWRLYSL